MVKEFEIFGVKISYFGELSSRNETDENDSDSTHSSDTDTSCQSDI